MRESDEIGRRDRPVDVEGDESGNDAEPKPGLKRGLADLPRNLNAFNLTTGLIPSIVLFITFAALQVKLLSEAGLSNDEITAWVCVSWTLGGLLGAYLSLRYKMPIAGAWSIPGFILTAAAFEGAETAEIFGGFWLSGVMVLLLGVTGAIRKVVSLVPTPVMMGMIAGVLFQFPVQVVTSFEESWIVATAGVVGYIVVDRLGGPLRRIPGILGTTVLGGIAAAATGTLDFSGTQFGLGRVEFVTPSFSLASVISIAVPLTLLVVGAENMQAAGILTAVGFKPPVTAMTVTSGIGGMLAALFGAHNANVAGPTTAVMASADAGPPRGRYVASTLSGVTYIVMALMAGTVVSLAGSIPASLTMVMIGMVLIRPVLGAIQSAWQSNSFAMGAFFAFVIGVSDVTFLGISAPFWSLLGGTVASVLFEFGSYRQGFVRGDDKSRAMS